MATLFGEAGLSTSSAAAYTALACALPKTGLRHGAYFPQGRSSSCVIMTGRLQFHGKSLPSVPRQRLYPHNRKTDVRGSSAGSDTERKFKTTVELDQLIDTLRATEDEQLPQIVAENILAFNTDFWLRLATRADLSNSPDDRRAFETMANSVMHIVHLIVQKAQEKIETSTDILKSILAPLIERNGEIIWPPRNSKGISIMRKEVKQREEGGYLDESFLSEVSAQLRQYILTIVKESYFCWLESVPDMLKELTECLCQAREDADKPGLVAILQKVLQLYCSVVMSKRSYAKKEDGIDKAEELLETLISGDEENWNNLIRNGLVFGGGSVESFDFSRVVEKRVERTLMRSETGSYQQRLLVEYVREIQTRAELLAEAFQAPGSGS